MSIGKIKSQARENLVHRYGSAVAATLFRGALVFLTLLVSCVCSFIALINSGWKLGMIRILFPGFSPSVAVFVIFLILGCAVLVFAVAFDFWMACGTTKMYLKICRGEKAGSGDIFYMFHKTARPWKALWVGVLRYILVVIAAAIPLFLSGCAIVCGYDPLTAAWNDPWRIAIRIVQVLSVLWMIYFGMRVYFAEFIIIDKPETGIGEALKESLRLTKGRVFKLLILMLSFIFWAALAYVVPVAYLWIIPYMDTSIALYYLEGLEKKETESITEQADKPEGSEDDPESTDKPEEAVPAAGAAISGEDTENAEDEEKSAPVPIVIPRKIQFPDIEAQAPCPADRKDTATTVKPENEIPVYPENEIPAQPETEKPVQPAKEE